MRTTGMKARIEKHIKMRLVKAIPDIKVNVYQIEADSIHFDAVSESFTEGVYHIETITELLYSSPMFQNKTMVCCPVTPSQFETRTLMGLEVSK